MESGKNKPVPNVVTRNLIIDSFQSTPGIQSGKYGEQIAGWNVKMNVFNVIEGLNIAGSHAALEIRNAQGETQGLPLIIPGWSAPPTALGRSIVGGGKIYGALTDPYSIIDSRDGINSNKVEVSVFVPAGSTIVVSKTSDWAFTYNCYTLFWDLLDLGMHDFDGKRDSLNEKFMNEFGKGITTGLLRKTSDNALLEGKMDYPVTLGLILEVGWTAVQATGDDVLIKAVKDKLEKKGWYKFVKTNGFITLAETALTVGNFYGQIDELWKNQINSAYKGNHIEIKTPTPEVSEQEGYMDLTTVPTNPFFIIDRGTNKMAWNSYDAQSPIWNKEMPLMDAKPVICQGRLLVPIGWFSNVVGFQTSWNPATSEVTITGAKTIKMKIGSKKASVDGRSLALDVPPLIVSGRTMVPLRFIGEAFDYQVYYNTYYGGDRYNGEVWITHYTIVTAEELQQLREPKPNAANFEFYGKENGSWDVYRLKEGGQTPKGNQLGDSVDQVLKIQGTPAGIRVDGEWIQTSNPMKYTEQISPNFSGLFTYSYCFNTFGAGDTFYYDFVFKNGLLTTVVAGGL